MICKDCFFVVIREYKDTHFAKEHICLLDKVYINSNIVSCSRYKVGEEIEKTTIEAVRAEQEQKVRKDMEESPDWEYVRDKIVDGGKDPWPYSGL